MATLHLPGGSSLAAVRHPSGISVGLRITKDFKPAITPTVSTQTSLLSWRPMALTSPGSRCRLSEQIQRSLTITCSAAAFITRQICLLHNSEKQCLWPRIPFWLLRRSEEHTSELQSHSF